MRKWKRKWIEPSDSSDGERELDHTQNFRLIFEARGKLDNILSYQVYINFTGNSKGFPEDGTKWTCQLITWDSNHYPYVQVSYRMLAGCHATLHITSFLCVRFFLLFYPLSSFSLQNTHSKQPTFHSLKPVFMSVFCCWWSQIHLNLSNFLMFMGLNSFLRPLSCPVCTL